MEILSPFQIAFSLLVTLEPELMGIISLSLGVSLAAVVLSLLIGLPFGAELRNAVALCVLLAWCSHCEEHVARNNQIICEK